MRRWWMAAAVASAVAGCQGYPDCGAPEFDTQGHRGARAWRPENTLPAMEYALARGVRTLELDLAVTSDDVLILSHDPVLAPGQCLKADGSPADGMKLRGMTLSEVRTLDCGQNSDTEFPNRQAVPNTPPPTLLEVLALAEARSGGSVHYNVEPKMDPAWGSDVTPDAERFMDLLTEVVAGAGVADRVTVQSFDPRPLMALKNRGSRLRRVVLFPSTAPSIHGAWITNNPIENAQWVGASAISPYAPVTQKPLVDQAHADGLAVIPWTVNDRAEMERLIDLGVDGLISDDVDLMMEVVGVKRPKGGVCF